ncbi:MAG: hypothetical protein R3F39_02065 [Myxococcota bacterium]
MRPLAIVTASLLTALTLVAACAHTGTRDYAASAPPDAVRHMPEPFPNAYIGMPYADWRAAHPNVAPPDADGFDFRIVISQPDPLPGVTEVTWYFDTDTPGQPLYEAIVDYGPNADRRAAAIAKLGPPNHGEEWMHQTSMGYPIKLWAFSTKVVIAAGMAGTEWDGEW